MAKCVMIKEKIDGQKTGQSSATPFMRVNDCGQSTDKSGKRGVTFDAMETLERQNDSIDKLTSLVSKMNVKIDRKETPYKPRVYQNRPRAQCRGRQQNFQPCNRSFSREKNEIQGIIIMTIEITHPTIEIGLEMITGMITEEIPTGPMKDAITTDKTIDEDITVGKQ